MGPQPAALPLSGDRRDEMGLHTQGQDRMVHVNFLLVVDLISIYEATLLSSALPACIKNTLF
jgi:hypothetical protein